MAISSPQTDLQNKREFDRSKLDEANGRNAAIGRLGAYNRSQQARITVNALTQAGNADDMLGAKNKILGQLSSLKASPQNQQRPTENQPARGGDSVAPHAGQPTAGPHTRQNGMGEPLRASPEKEQRGPDETGAEDEDMSDNPTVDKDEEKQIAREMREEQIQNQQDEQQQLAAAEATALVAQAEAEAASQETQVTGRVPQRLPTFPFVIMLILAIIKDGVDFFDWGFLGVVLNLIPIMGILITVLITGGSLMDFMSKKKWLIGAGATVEFIPLVGFMPIWTITIVWMWIEGRRGKQVSGQLATRYTRRIASSESAQRYLRMIK